MEGSSASRVQVLHLIYIWNSCNCNIVAKVHFLENSSHILRYGRTELALHLTATMVQLNTEK